MRKIATLIGFSLLATVARANVHTVNNNVPSPGQFTSIPAAISAATAGDTIYVAGSPYNYNSFTISKQLTIIGTGWQPRATNGNISQVDDIDFSGGSTASGSTIIGLVVSQINVSQPVNNLTIARNKITYRVLLYTNLNNTLIEGNWFSYNSGNGIQGNHSDLDNLTVRNNVIDTRIATFNYYGNGANNYFLNNLFVGNGSGNQGFTDFYYGTMRNNIFYGRTAASTSYSTWENNITFNNTDNNIYNGTQINNQTGVDPEFVNAPVGSYTTANNYALQPGSPAINAGTDGSDIGLSGGDGYFETHGVPGIPQIRDFQITSPAGAQVNPGGTLNIKVISTIKR